MLNKLFKFNKKGVTMTSLTIYIIVATIVVGILAFLNANFFANINDLTKKSNIVGDYLDFKSAFIRDIKAENNLTVVDFNNNMIRLSNNVQYEFRLIDTENSEGKYALYRDDIQIAKNIVSHTENNGTEVKTGPYFEYDAGTNTVKVGIKFYDGENEQYEDGTYVVGKEITYSWENTPNNSDVQAKPTPEDPGINPESHYRVYATLYSDGYLKVGNTDPTDRTRIVVATFGEMSKTIENGNPKWLEKKNDIRTVEITGKIYLKSLENLFSGCINLKEIKNINNIDVSEVKNAENAFKNCRSLTELNTSWNTNRFINMNSMFEDCSSLKSLNLNSFNTENVESMARLFKNCSKINNLSFDNFSTEKVKNMSEMFSGCSSLTDLRLTNLVTANVTDMSNMFANCTSLVNLNIEYFNTSNVKSLSRLFYNCQSLQTIKVGTFETPDVTDFSYLFYNCLNLKSVELGKMNTTSLKNVSHMFENCARLKTINLNNFSMDNVTDMSRMFYGCQSIEVIDLNSFNTSKVSNMKELFAGCLTLKTLNGIDKINTAGTHDMSAMFKDCASLQTLNLSNFNTESVTDLSEMFEGCQNLSNLTVKFKTPNVTTMASMFEGCSSLTVLDISTFETTILEDMSAMFRNASALKSIYVSKDENVWNTNNVENTQNMFEGCGTTSFASV